MTCEFEHSDGVYVLGALSPAERTAFQSHLAGCRQCTSAVARLAPMPGLLGRVDPTTLTPIPREAPDRLPRLLAAVDRRRRRRTWARRWQLAAVAAATALLALSGSAIWSGLTGGTGSAGPMVAMEPVGQAAPVIAEVATAPTVGGTEVRMACHYPSMGYEAPASTFRLVAVGPDGQTEQLGSWRAAPGDEVELSGTTRFTGDELRRIELHGDDGAVLLTARPG